MTCEILVGDALDMLRTLPDGIAQTCVTSPPYWGLRDYGVDGQIGLERNPDEYVAKMVSVFREVRRVLRDNGTLWLNLGDSYSNIGKTGGSSSGKHAKSLHAGHQTSSQAHGGKIDGLKPKDLVGIPWLVAFALRADGWYLRSDIIWCLSGGTWVYAKTQKGEGPTTVKDLARLDPATVKLWNGEKWTQLLGMSKSKRRGEELEIVLRSGERIACTPTHRFPTDRGLLDASDIRVGDVIQSCRPPEPATPKDCAIDEDAAWFAGLYLAEGSRSEDTIQISGHTKEAARWARVQSIATRYGGSATRTIDGNNMSIRVYGRILNAIIDELVTGRTAHDKGFAPVVWRYSNRFVAAMVDGYLSGDGGQDGNRWTLGFCRNYNLERDLRTACARLGYRLILRLSSAKCHGRRFSSFHGELRKTASGHHNEKDRSEVVEIRKARCRYVYDLGVENEPHLFALASGVLTHNSKPNPMPESVTDRPTKAHEYVFLLTKSARYFYDADAVREANRTAPKLRRKASESYAGCHWTPIGKGEREWHNQNGRNRRTVWTVTPKPFRGAHFATMPPDLVEPCVLAGSRPGDVVLDPFSGAGTTGLVALHHGRRFIGIDLNPEYAEMARERITKGWSHGPRVVRKPEMRKSGHRQADLFDVLGVVG